MPVILHTSDLHGNYSFPFRLLDFDIYLDSGDYFPNISRGEPIETRWQTDWFRLTKRPLEKRYKAWIRNFHQMMPAAWYPPQANQPRFSKPVCKQLIAWLAGRPVISVPGNHDWVSLAHMLQSVGYQNAWDLTDGPVEVLGIRFSGFREIPYITGEWQGEVGTEFMPGDFNPIVQKLMRSDPQVIVTHSPPYGILDQRPPFSPEHLGITALTNWLARKSHSVSHSLFGHVHESGGKGVEVMGIEFYNSAKSAQLVEV